MIRDILAEEVRSVLQKTGHGNISPAISRSRHFGDYMSPAPRGISSERSRQTEYALSLTAELKKSERFRTLVKNIEEKDGFINFFLSEGALLNELKELFETLENGTRRLSGRNINIEFVSANPTGELHLGHGRNAFYGDALARVLSFASASVAKEFYINDAKASRQIQELGKTALERGEEYKTPELAATLSGVSFEGLSEPDAGFRAALLVQEENKKLLENAGVSFDRWYSEEKEIYENGRAQGAFEMLQEKGFLYEKDGAIWIKTSEYGDDEDRVVRRSDGTFTYFISDIAYHHEKFSRGFDTVIDVWGADHHGHVKRVQAVKRMLGWKGELLVFITQLVSLKEGGEMRKMSKRAGTAILLKDLIADIGLDAARWFFNEKSLGTHIAIDVALAKDASSKNPVYYAQYAHARMSSILKSASTITSVSGVVSFDESERNLAFKILEFSEIVDDIAVSYHVHKLTTYAYELAAEFNQFYRDSKVLGSPEEKKRLALVLLAEKTLARTLFLLGISAPDKM